MNRSTEFLRFWSSVLRLKRLRRQGWIDRGVTEPESTADHTFGVALLAWLLAREQPEFDAEKVLLLALVHDLPEALAGDVTPFDALRDDAGKIDPRQFRETPPHTDIARQQKFDAEARALDEMLRHLDSDSAATIRVLWHEYEMAATPEARFVRQIDKLETLIQADDYLGRAPDLVIDSFWHGSRRDITDPVLVRLMTALQSPDPDAE